jgi:hypothetical protein
MKTSTLLSIATLALALNSTLPAFACSQVEKTQSAVIEATTVKPEGKKLLRSVKKLASKQANVEAASNQIDVRPADGSLEYGTDSFIFGE